MGIDQFEKLLSLSGLELLDAGARLVGKPEPSRVAKPLTSVNPNLIKPTQDEWWRAADQLIAHLEGFRTQRAVVMANWDVPKGFPEYMDDMATKLEELQRAMHGVSWQLDGISKTLSDAKEGAELRIKDAGFAVAMGIVATLIGAAAGGAGGAVAAGIVTAIIVALITWLYQRSNSLDKKLRDQNGQLEALKALVSQTNLKKVTLPSPPDLSNVKGFSSIHEPRGV
ncbi:hypothetical protein [Actinomadura craniellae]|uniref:hypothetical protein n=1 Tax=Actinomadura craniellae TaxID=2231787 RepID=UPI0011BF97C2|nr:hypothetical protein [Actinomadura craniellae]